MKTVQALFLTMFLAACANNTQSNLHDIAQDAEKLSSYTECYNNIKFDPAWWGPWHQITTALAAATMVEGRVGFGSSEVQLACSTRRGGPSVDAAECEVNYNGSLLYKTRATYTIDPTNDVVSMTAHSGTDVIGDASYIGGQLVTLQFAADGISTPNSIGILTFPDQGSITGKLCIYHF